MISSRDANKNFREIIEIREEIPVHTSDPRSIRVRDLLHVVNSDVHIFERGCPIPKLKIPNGLGKKYTDYIGESVLNACVYETSCSWWKTDSLLGSTRDGHLNVFIEPISKEEHDG